MTHLVCTECHWTEPPDAFRAAEQHMTDTGHNVFCVAADPDSAAIARGAQIAAQHVPASLAMLRELVGR